MLFRIFTQVEDPTANPKVGASGCVARAHVKDRVFQGTPLVLEGLRFGTPPSDTPKGQNPEGREGYAAGR